MKTRYTCPDCNKAKKYVRYIDKETNRHLPFQYGKCERLNQCGYHLNPYTDGYWKMIKDQERNENNTSKAFNKNKTRYNLNPQTKTEPTTIPSWIFKSSLTDYSSNSFASFLSHHLGHRHTVDLVKQFYIGTSKYWGGATVFWLINDKMKIAGGQVILFDDKGHTYKETRTDGSIKRYNSWVHIALKAHYQNLGIPLPDWLNGYINNSPKFPCLFGLHQLHNESGSKPIAIVEAAKTAVIASGYFPQFIWMAAGSLSYLNEDRLAPLKGRKITLFPDKGGYDRWRAVANNLSDLASINVSKLLELENAEPGSDLADYLINFYPKDFTKECSSLKHTKHLTNDNRSLNYNEANLPKGWLVDNWIRHDGIKISILINEHGYPVIWDEV